MLLNAVPLWNTAHNYNYLIMGPGTVAHAYNSSYLGDWEDQPRQNW
jgi:hypothetical protein